MLRPESARRIDYWIGIPLCFVATVLLRLARLIRTQPSSSLPIQRVLFIELSEMGSAVLADPAMCFVRARTGSQLYFLIFERNASSLRILDTVNPENVFTIRDDGLLTLAWDSFRFLLWSRRNGIDTVIDLELFSRFTAILTGLSGARRRVGFHRFHHEGLYRGSMLTHQVAYNPHIHIAKNFMALAHASVSSRAEIPFTKTYVSDGDVAIRRRAISHPERQAMIERVRSRIRDFDPLTHRLVLINPNSSGLLPQRAWMPENYARLIQMILDSAPDIHVLLTGSLNEKPEAETLLKMAGRTRCHSFAGATTLRELPALYDLSELMVTNDSGPAHFASVTGMRTFVLFGPETPRLYGSLGVSTPITAELACSPCVAATNHRKTTCRDPICLKVISADTVFAAVRAELAAPRRSVRKPEIPNDLMS